MLEQIKKRPLAAFAITFYIASCVLYSSESGIRRAAILFSAIILAILVGISAFRSLEYTGGICLILSGVIAASVFSTVMMDVRLARAERLSGIETEITGTVTGVSFSASFGGIYTVKVDKDSGDVGKMKVSLTAENGELCIGDRIKCTAVLSAHDPDGDFREYMLSNGVMLSAEAKDGLIRIGEDDGFLLRLYSIRSKLSGIFLSGMSHDSGGFAAALLLGDKGRVSDEMDRDFRALGISHILALSGTQLTLIFGTADRLIPNGRRGAAKFVILTSAVILYMMMTGLSASVVRSGIMFIIGLAGRFLMKKSDTTTSLAASVLIICIFNPYAPLDAGLQLSFASVIGLIISDRTAKRFIKGRSRVFRIIVPAAVTAFIVPVAVLPLMWLRFGEVSLISPLANLILVPLTSLMLPVFLFLLALYPAGVLFIPAAGAVDLIVKLFLKLVRFAASGADFVLPLSGVSAQISVICFSAAVIAAAIGSSGSSGKQRKVSRCALLIASASVIVSAATNCGAFGGNFTVCFASGSTGDAVLADIGGTSVLIDSGDGYKTHLTDAIRLAESEGFVRIDHLFLTHLHKRHRIAVAELCSKYYVGCLWLPVPSGDDEMISYRTARDAALSHGTEVRSYIPGESFAFGDAEFVTYSDYAGSAHPFVGFKIAAGSENVIYGAYDAGVYASETENTIYIAASHRAYPIFPESVSSGKLRSVFPPSAARSLNAVPASAIVSDKAVITRGDGTLRLIAG